MKMVGRIYLRQLWYLVTELEFDLYTALYNSYCAKDMCNKPEMSRKCAP